jgi:hypothetical protein
MLEMDLLFVARNPYDYRTEETVKEIDVTSSLDYQ